MPPSTGGDRRLRDGGPAAGGPHGLSDTSAAPAAGDLELGAEDDDRAMEALFREILAPGALAPPDAPLGVSAEGAAAPGTDAGAQWEWGTDMAAGEEEMRRLLEMLPDVQDAPLDTLELGLGLDLGFGSQVASDAVGVF